MGWPAGLFQPKHTFTYPVYPKLYNAHNLRSVKYNILYAKWIVYNTWDGEKIKRSDSPQSKAVCQQVVQYKGNLAPFCPGQWTGGKAHYEANYDNALKACKVAKMESKIYS